MNTNAGEGVISWLLEEDNPPVRYLTLNNILKDPKKAKETRSSLISYHPTQEILKNLETFLKDDDKAYWKYTGKYWQVIFLGQFLADGKNPAVTRLVENILVHRKWIWKNGGQCLTANLLAAFMKLGYSDHPVVKEETENLAKNVVSNIGIRCNYVHYSLLSRCYMAIPKLLLCFSEIPSRKRSHTVKDAINMLVDTKSTFMYLKPEGSGRKSLKTNPSGQICPRGKRLRTGP